MDKIFIITHLILIIFGVASRSMGSPPPLRQIFLDHVYAVLILQNSFIIIRCCCFLTCSLLIKFIQSYFFYYIFVYYYIFNPKQKKKKKKFVSSNTKKPIQTIFQSLRSKKYFLPQVIKKCGIN